MENIEMANKNGNQQDTAKTVDRAFGRLQNAERHGNPGDIKRADNAFRQALKNNEVTILKDIQKGK
jgi:hypothetical protein